jgi:hypothetical protein
LVLSEYAGATKAKILIPRKAIKANLNWSLQQTKDLTGPNIFITA